LIRTADHVHHPIGTNRSDPHVIRHAGKYYQQGWGDAFGALSKGDTW
jgi:hypothetical protein